MKSEPIRMGGAQIDRPGTLIGKALEPLEKRFGEDFGIAEFAVIGIEERKPMKTNQTFMKRVIMLNICLVVLVSAQFKSVLAQWTGPDAGNNIYYNSGNVGIGTSAPSTISGLDLSTYKVLHVFSSGSIGTRLTATGGSSAGLDLIHSGASANQKWPGTPIFSTIPPAWDRFGVLVASTAATWPSLPIRRLPEI